MNKFVLNFSDFILNENNRVDKTLSNNTLYEENSTVTQTLDDVIRDRLRTKLQRVCESPADADMIVGKSQDLIDAAVKVYNKEPSSDFFKENIGSILSVGAVLVGGFIILKTGKKIKLGNTLTNVIKGIKTKFENPIKKIILDKWSTFKTPYDELILNCNSTLKYIKDIEEKSYYTNLNTKGREFFIGIEKITNALKTSFDEQYKFINDQTIFEGPNLKKKLDVIKNEINKHTTIIKSKINDLKLQNIDDLVKPKPIPADSKIITMPDYSSNKTNSNEIWDDIKKIISKNEKFIKKLEKLDLACDDILTKTGITKPSTTDTIEDVILQAVAKAGGKQIPITTPPPKFIERLKKYGIPLVAISSIFLIYNSWSVISELFKDTPELESTINIVNNPEQSKEYYVKQMESALSTFTYDNVFSGLNVWNVKFKPGYEAYSSNLKGAILYDLAQLIINNLQELAAIYMYGIIEKTTQA
jgi:hypothetical protein